MTIDRRRFLAAGAVAGAAFALPGWAKSPAYVAPRTVPLAVSPQRATTLAIWEPKRAKGVALFSTGHGSWPERYEVLVAMLMAQGFVVLAPVHVDSMHYPDRDKFTMQASFPERLADMRAASALAAKEHPGLPVIAVGHSFGTLTALCLGGALRNMADFRDARVKAVLGFSTPGKSPGLIQPTAYAGVAVPLMIVTGTADTVPGFAPDPADHLFPAQTAPTETFALIETGADHGLVAATGPAATRAFDAARLFIDGYGLDQRAARAKLTGWHANRDERFVHKVAA